VAASKDRRPGPPLSLTIAWDKGKWHYDAANFPAHLPRSAGYAHIMAVLRFLDGKGMLTAEGKEELAGALGDDTALVNEQVRRAARAFLDQYYDAYLGELEEYGAAPPTHFLERAWEEYERRYDLRKRTVPDPYQKLLLEHYDHTRDAVLRALSQSTELLARLREALPFVPEADRPLVNAVLAAWETDLRSFAERADDPALALRALRFVSGSVERLRATAALARRMGVTARGVEVDVASRELAALVADGTHAPGDAILSLSPGDQLLLASIVNALYQHGDRRQRHAALLAMGTVGDLESARLIRTLQATTEEGTIESGGRPPEPLWNSLRRSALEAIEGRRGE
jgi:hypothetical protein